MHIYSILQSANKKCLRREKMAYNYKKLLGRIVEIYGTQYEFAKVLGVSEHTLSMKLNNKVNFKQSEIAKACELLNISSIEVSDYFLPKKFKTFNFFNANEKTP